MQQPFLLRVCKAAAGLTRRISSGGFFMPFLKRIRSLGGHRHLAGWNCLNALGTIITGGTIALTYPGEGIARDSNSANGGSAASVLFAGMNTAAANAESYLRFVNTGDRAGAAHVTLFYAATGAEVATWGSPSLPRYASLEVSVAKIAATAIPSLTEAQSAESLVLQVDADFNGEVQHISANNNGPVNLTACGKKLAPLGIAVGGVTGPNNPNLTDIVRIVNSGSQSSRVTLAIYNGADGVNLGEWVSPAVPPHGSLAIYSSMIIGAATVAIDSRAGTLTVVADHLKAGMRLEHLTQSKASSVIADLSTTCRLGARATDADEEIGVITNADEAIKN